MVVRPGPLSQVSRLEFLGAPDNFFKHSRPWPVQGQTLTPEFLNRWESWAVSRLKAQGYPCAQSSSRADPATGEVWVQMHPGSKMNFPEVQRAQTSLDQRIWPRYDAFSEGQTYNHDLLELTSQRITREAVAENAYFITRCLQETVELEQKIHLGPSQFVAVGVGATTQEYPILRLRWRHARLNSQAATLEAIGYFSSRLQSVELRPQFYVWPQAPWWSLSPTVTLERESESVFESTLIKWQGHVNYNRDDRYSRWYVQAGPTQNFRWNVTGPGQDYLSYMSLETQVARISHDFEKHFADPKQGYEWQFRSNSQVAGMLAPETAHILSFQGRQLWNLGRWQPARWILGLRYHLQSTWSQERDTRTSLLGPDFRQFLGGDRNIRGFDRNQISGQGFGYFTSVYAGGELRWSNRWPWGIEPLFFLDWARVGYRSFTLDPGYLWSPGVGLRLSSLIGVFRFTWGYGVNQVPDLIESGIPNQGQWFMSYGTEF
jgi:outer membrane translocation and assembly module TamA